MKDNHMKTFENVVDGPVSMLTCATDLSGIDRETLSRFYILHLDESAEQTQRILDHQQRMSGVEGLAQKARAKEIERLLRNVMRLLKPLPVSNTVGVGVNYPPHMINSRRERAKLELLVRAVAILHQYQRPLCTARVGDGEISYIDVTQEDVDAVWNIASDVLRQSIDDELSKLGRDLLRHIHQVVNEKYESRVVENPDLKKWQVVFTRKEIKQRCHWSRYHVEQYLQELIEGNYIAPQFGKQGQRYTYCKNQKIIFQEGRG